MFSELWDVVSNTTRGAMWTAMCSYTMLGLLKLVAVVRPLRMREWVTTRRCVALIAAGWLGYALYVALRVRAELVVLAAGENDDDAEGETAKEDCIAAAVGNARRLQLWRTLISAIRLTLVAMYAATIVCFVVTGIRSLIF